MRISIAALGMWLAASAAYAAEKGRLTLVCNGTYEANSYGGPYGPSIGEPQPVTSLGVVVNFSEHEVEAVKFGGHIEDIDGASISFKNPGDDFPMSGSIDRVTGALEAFKQIALSSGEKINYSYHLHCKPAKRMF
jgi:hypothetical protein